MIEKLYDQLVGLLGSPANNTVVDEISRELCEAPKLTHSNPDVQFEFPKHGFSLMVLNGQIYSVFLHGDTIQTRFRGWSHFGNPMPKQIRFGDSRSDVHTKLGEPTSATRLEHIDETPGDYFDDYSIGALVARYIFDGRRELLCAISIRCNDDDDDDHQRTGKLC
jgi:hypothetical protein